VSYPFVKATLGGLQYILAKPAVKKEPAIVKMLETIMEDSENSEDQKWQSAQGFRLYQLRLLEESIQQKVGALRIPSPRVWAAQFEGRWSNCGS